MSEECFSTLSVTNYYQDGKLTGYSVADGEIVSLPAQEPLEVPELFPILPEYKNPECTKEGNEPPDLEEWLKRGRK